MVSVMNMASQIINNTEHETVEPEKEKKINKNIPSDQVTSLLSDVSIQESLSPSSESAIQVG